MSAGVPTDLIGVTEAAKLLPGIRPGKCVNIATVYRWIRDGILPAWKIRKNVYVRKTDVLQLAVPVPLRPRLQPAADQSEANQAAEEYLRAAGWL